MLLGPKDNWTETPKGQQRRSWENPLKNVCLKSALSSSTSHRNEKRISIYGLPTLCQVLLHASFCYIMTIILQGRCLLIRNLNLARIKDLPKVICLVSGKPWFQLKFLWFLKLCPHPVLLQEQPPSYYHTCYSVCLLRICISFKVVCHIPWMHFHLDKNVGGAIHSTCSKLST